MWLIVQFCYFVCFVGAGFGLGFCFRFMLVVGYGCLFSGNGVTVGFSDCVDCASSCWCLLCELV